MKLLVVSFRSGRSASTVFRVEQHAGFWAAAGVEMTQLALGAGTFEEILTAASRHDLVLLQKKMLPSRMVKRLRQANPALVFEFDDAIWGRDSKKTGWWTNARRMWQFGGVVRQARAVTCTNEYLAGFARKYQAHVHIVPLSLDTRVWTPPEEMVPTRRIGWMGAKVTQHHLVAMAPALDEFLKKHPDWELEVCSEAPVEGFAVPHKLVPFVDGKTGAMRPVEGGLPACDYGNGPEVVRGWEIGLTPLRDTAFARGKSAIKTLQYMACGVVPLVSNVGSAAEMVRDGEDGYLVREGWGRRLEELAEDEGLRMRMRRAARERAVADFSAEKSAGRFLKVFDKVLGS